MNVNSYCNNNKDCYLDGQVGRGQVCYYAHIQGSASGESGPDPVLLYGNPLAGAEVSDGSWTYSNGVFTCVVPGVYGVKANFNWTFSDGASTMTVSQGAAGTATVSGNYLIGGGVVNGVSTCGFVVTATTGQTFIPTAVEGGLDDLEILDQASFIEFTRL